MLLWASANRDERFWSNPTEFNIERPNRRAHFAFGHGIHTCLGQQLARLEARVAAQRAHARALELQLTPLSYDIHLFGVQVRIAVEELLKRSTTLTADPRRAAPAYLPSAFVRTLSHLHVRVRLQAATPDGTASPDGSASPDAAAGKKSANTTAMKGGLGSGVRQRPNATRAQ